MPEEVPDPLSQAEEVIEATIREEVRSSAEDVFDAVSRTFYEANAVHDEILVESADVDFQGAHGLIRRALSEGHEFYVLQLPAYPLSELLIVEKYPGKKGRNDYRVTKVDIKSRSASSDSQIRHQYPTFYEYLHQKFRFSPLYNA